MKGTKIYVFIKFYFNFNNNSFLLLIFIPLNINLYINSEQIYNSYIDFSWLYPFLNIRLFVNDDNIFIKISVFKKALKLNKYNLAILNLTILLKIK